MRGLAQLATVLEMRGIHKEDDANFLMNEVRSNTVQLKTFIAEILRSYYQEMNSIVQSKASNAEIIKVIDQMNRGTYDPNQSTCLSPAKLPSNSNSTASLLSSSTAKRWISSGKALSSFSSPSKASQMLRGTSSPKKKEEVKVNTPKDYFFSGMNQLQHDMDQDAMVKAQVEQNTLNRIRSVIRRSVT